jgi:hypothetical protein
MSGHPVADNELIDWSRENSKLIPWDDGHTPECVKLRSAEGCLRIYPEVHDDASKFVATLQNAGPPALADSVYDFTVHHLQSPTRTWGTYVLMKDAKLQAAAGCTIEPSAASTNTHGASMINSSIHCWC